jgi:hypothetical protein
MTSVFDADVKVFSDPGAGSRMFQKFRRGFSKNRGRPHETF